MAQNITDLAEWKKKHPILGKFWDTYNEFDKPVEGDIRKSWYHTFCDPFMAKFGDHNEEQKNFCLKLVRNLGGRYSVQGDQYFNPNKNRCRILDYWVYNSARKHKISDEIISGCFQDYIEFMKHTGREHKCFYYKYDDLYEEPMNIILLDIFQSNMNVIENKLDGRYVSIKLPLQMYICECIDIFKKMYKEYCPKMDADSEKRKRTCNMLELIKTTYNLFISGKLYQNNKMPSLDNDSDEYFDMCPQNNPNSKLRSEAKGVSHVLEPLNVVIDEDTDEASSYVGYKNYETDGVPSLSEGNGGNQVSPTARTVSTTVGTIAGASSVLALLYKFSPARRLVHSGIQGNRGRMNSNFYEDGPTDLLFDGVQGEDMSSYNPSYNIGYGSV